MALTFRMLVRRFPELAEKVFDACITQKEKDVIEFDFQFLDDTYTLERVEEDDKVKKVDIVGQYLQLVFHYTGGLQIQVGVCGYHLL